MDVCEKTNILKSYINVKQKVLPEAHVDGHDLLHIVRCELVRWVRIVGELHPHDVAQFGDLLVSGGKPISYAILLLKYKVLFSP